MFYAIVNFFFVLSHMSFWIQNNRTDTTYDKQIRLLLKTNPKVEFITPHTAMIGDNLIWVANYPYAYGSLYSSNGSNEFLPRGLTRHRLNAYIMKQSVKI